MSAPQRSEKAEVFFSSKNEGVLQRVLYTDICRRIGGDLNEKQASRLMKTVKHYMGEVYRVKGVTQNVQTMNTEVLQIVLPDYMMYMERVAASSSRSVISDIERGPAETTGAVSGAIEDRRRDQLDVGAAFTQLQANRQNANKTKAPEMQDFRLTLQDEGPVPMDVFERMKQDREAEAQRASIAAAASSSGSAYANQQTFAEATDVFARNRRRADQESEQAFAERERQQLQARAAAAAAAQENLPMPPDMRSLILGDRQNLERTMNRPGPPNGSAGNPTLALGDSMRESMGGAQQMIITREPSTMAYKETELNLFVYSGDRNWATNSGETRYNFSVSFDSGNALSGMRLTPTTTVKFRNIVRIELVKAIMPGESLDPIVTRSQDVVNCTAFLTNSTPDKLTVLSITSGVLLSSEQTIL